MYETFMYIAIPSTIAMLVFLVLSLVGIGDTDLETDIDSDSDSDDNNGFPIFTIKNLVTFLTMFGSVGMACVSYGLSNSFSILLASTAGILFVLFMTGLFVLINKLARSNVMSLDEAVGKEVTVYSRITKDMPGQVNVILNGSLQTIMASSDKTFQTGDTVKVVSRTETGLVVDSI